MSVSVDEMKKLRENLDNLLSEERITLLRRYFYAMNFFYHDISLKRMLRIINQQNEEKFTEEEFLAFVEVIRNEQHCFYILGEDEIYEDVPKCKPILRKLIHDSLLLFDNESYEEIERAKSEMPYYVPEKEELLKYEDELYCGNEPAYFELENFLKNCGYDQYTFEDHIDDAKFCSESNSYSFIEYLEKYEYTDKRHKCSIVLPKQKLITLEKLYKNFHNNHRNPYLNGFTPTECFRKYGNKKISRYI